MTDSEHLGENEKESREEKEGVDPLIQLLKNKERGVLR